MTGFVKLDCTILESTIWAEPDDVLRVWIALLAKADSFGVVNSTLPAMANQCRTTLDRMHQILELFKAPDPYSRTPDNEGRRIEDIEGGWLILNYVKHREITQGKPGSHAERQRRYRERVANRDASVTRKSVTRDEVERHKRNEKVTRDTEAEAEEERAKEEEREKPTAPKPQTLAAPAEAVADLLSQQSGKEPALPKPAKAAGVRTAIEIDTWLDSLGDADAIAADDPIFGYAEKAGIPREFLALAWDCFCDDMRERHTRKKDWRAHFRNSVRNRWYRLWYFSPDGDCRLTTEGEQARRAA